jgi:NifU-like protein
MSFYPTKINEQFLHPRFAGELANATIVERNASFVCGSVLQISLQVEGGRIVRANFKAAGCGYLFAAADILCEKIIDHSIVDFKFVTKRNYQTLSASIENVLNEFPPDRKHCLELVTETFLAIIQNSQFVEINNWNGDDALICVCFGVSEKTIIVAVQDDNLKTVSEVTQKCNAGGGCGSCQLLIQDILDDLSNRK